MKPERKFWHEIKTFVTKNNCKLSFTRLENSAAWGTPDLLGYNSFGNFFTIELKVTRGNTLRFSPHQFSFHLRHPKNTFILVKALSLNQVKLYEGKVIRELDACGLKLAPHSLGLEACCLHLEQLGAWRLPLAARVWACCHLTLAACGPDQVHACLEPSLLLG